MATRGMIANTAGTALFMVVDNTLYKVSPVGIRQSLGTLVTTRGTVDMKIGQRQLVIVDGAFGYVYDLSTTTFTRITTTGFLGSYTVEYLDGYFSFLVPGSNVFYLSKPEDATTIDILDQQPAQTGVGNLVGQVSTSHALVLFKETNAEVWQDSGGALFPLSLNEGVFVEAGALSPYAIKEMDNTVYWLGRDERGAGVVYNLQGFRPIRISTMAVEQTIQQAIQDGNDMSTAVAYTYQQNGHSFYVLQVPGLETTWVYDAASQMWHERAELVLGQYQQHRGRYHAYCYGKHLISGDDGVIYQYDPNANDNAGDVLVRDRVSPHFATPQLERIMFSKFELDCTVGFGLNGDQAATVMLRYSNDGGYSWSDWRYQTLGAVGEKQARAKFSRCGSARDRVWHVRCTDNVPFAIVNANVETA